MESHIDHSENIVEISDVSFSYGPNAVLNNITLNIHRGDYLAIVGGNGSGKTTLLKIMLGLLSPSKGSIKLFGTELTTFTEWKKIGYVPQKATNFDANFPATVFEVVLMGRYATRGLFNRIKKNDKDAAIEALKNVEMLDFKDRLIGDLSGGQQQRVFIARALAGNPEVLFLDEPTVGVETQIKEEFYSLLRSLNTKMYLTIVLITHDIESMSNEAMHVACIDHTLFFHDTIDQYFKSTHTDLHSHH